MLTHFRQPAMEFVQVPGQVVASAAEASFPLTPTVTAESRNRTYL